MLAGAPAALGASQGIRIIGGTPASPGEYPAQGLLVVDESDLCGGTLLSSEWFLTAAHCVAGAGSLEVLLGDHDLALPNTDWYPVVGIDVHSGFNPITAQNDVAFLRLGRAAPYTPLRVIGADESATWAADSPARIIGWGATVEGGGSSETLLEADVRIVADPTCVSAYSTHFRQMDPATMVCAAETGVDTCEGDSGGPLMVRDGLGAWALAGITSWGEGCARPEYPGVYTRAGAPAINAWIRGPRPTASFTSTSAQSGQPVTFTSTSTGSDGPFSSFAWDLDGDGLYNDGTGATASRAFPAGTIVVGLEVSRPDGDLARTRQTLLVNAPPLAVAGGADGYVVREGASVVLMGIGQDPEGQVLGYRWDLDGDGSFESVGREATFSALAYDGPLSRVATLQVCDSAGGCSQASATVRVLNAAPRANAGPDRRVRRGQRTRFFMRASDPGRDPLKVTWRFGDGRTAKGSRVSHVFRRAGLFTVRATVTDGDGGSTTDRVRVRVRR